VQSSRYLPTQVEPPVIHMKFLPASIKQAREARVFYVAVDRTTSSLSSGGLIGLSLIVSCIMYLIPFLNSLAFSDEL
jgi:hypothetical protein